MSPAKFVNAIRQTARGFHLQVARQRPQVFIIDVFIITKLLSFAVLPKSLVVNPSYF